MTEIESIADEARDARIKRVADALQIVVKMARDTAEGAAKEGGLHPTDFSCIGFLVESGRALSPKEIIAHLGISSGSGTALLDRLEKHGYVRRLPNPDDRRGVLISLDGEASQGVIALHDKVKGSFREATSGLSIHDLDVVADFLLRISRLAEIARSVPMDEN